MSRAAAVIDLESYRRRREARAAAPKAAPSSLRGAAAPSPWMWVVWVPVVWYWR
jgi:hypothetical protein